MLFTTINDIPALRNMPGQSKRKGEACPHCLEETCSLWLPNSKKFVYVGHGRFLPKKHTYRKMHCQFDGQKETQTTPQHVSGIEIHQQVEGIRTIEELPTGKEIIGKRK
jgi:hypothetical protein